MIPDVADHLLELLSGEKWRAGHSASGPLTRVYPTERFSACHQRPAHKGQTPGDCLPQAHCLFIPSGISIGCENGIISGFHGHNHLLTWNSSGH
jgi:hypothetical protein